MLKRKKLFILFILLFLSFGNIVLANEKDTATLEVFHGAEVYVGDSVSFKIAVKNGGMTIGQNWKGEVNFGDGQGTGEMTCHAGWKQCTMVSSYNYTSPGTFIISGYAINRNPSAVDDGIDFLPYTITILSKGCDSNGCGGGCPDGCTVDEDPDCDCVSGNGCCPDNCTYITDADCDPSGNDSEGRYKNPLIFTNIVQFIWHSLTFIFTLLISLSALFILIGAYVLVTSGGNQIKVNKGKKIIIFTLIGFAIALISRGIIALLLTMMGE